MEQMNGINGLTVIGTDGIFYVVEHGMRRKVASQKAMDAWGLQLKPVCSMLPDQLGLLAEGMPIIAPVRVAPNL